VPDLQKQEETKRMSSVESMQELYSLTHSLIYSSWLVSTIGPLLSVHGNQLGNLEISHEAREKVYKLDVRAIPLINTGFVFCYSGSDIRYGYLSATNQLVVEFLRFCNTLLM
jgi:hypothetical protein